MPVFQTQKTGITCFSFDKVFAKSCFPEPYNSRSVQTRQITVFKHYAVKALMHKTTVWAFWWVLWSPVSGLFPSLPSLKILVSFSLCKNQTETFRNVTGWNTHFLLICNSMSLADQITWIMFQVIMVSQPCLCCTKKSSDPNLTLDYN